MTRINTNVASLRGLRGLNRANNQLDSALTRLSTGLKINSGKDNPSGLIASESLRTQISAIEQSIKNSGRANNVIATADAALGEVGGLLNQVRGLVQESLNNGALSQSEIEANQLQIDAALDAINRISANTTFAGDKLIDGSKSFNTQISTTDAAKLQDFQIDQALFTSSSTIELEAVITQAAEKAQLNFSQSSVSESTTLEIGGNGGNQVLFFDANSSKSDVKSAINGISDITGVVASQTAGLEIQGTPQQGEVEISTTATAATLSRTIAATQAATLDFGLDNATAAALDVSFNAGADVIQLTDARATNQTGAVADLGGDITFEIVDTGSGGATIDVTGNAITVDLGGATLDVDGLETLIDGDTAAAALVGTSVTTGGSGNIAVTASQGLAADGADGTNESVIQLTDARATGDIGQVADLGGDITLEIVDTGSGGNTIDVTGNAITIDLGGATADADAIQALIAGDTDAAALVNSTVTSGGSQNGVVKAAEGLAADGTDGTDALILDLTDARATATTGAVADLGGDITFEIVDTAAGGASISVTGNAITVDLGGATLTGDELQSLIAGDSAAAALVTSSITSGDATNAAVTASQGLAADGTDGLNSSVLTITDNRNSGSGGSAATLGGELFVQVGDFSGGTANQTLGASFQVDSSGNTILQVQLATDGSGAAQGATAADIQTAIDAAAASSDNEVTTSLTGANTSTLATTAQSFQLTGGSDGENEGITFFDAQAFGALQTVSVRFDDSSANQNLGLSVTETATSIEFTFTLGTDANGDVTTTASDIRDLLNNGTGDAENLAREVLDFEIEGDGSEIVGSNSSLEAVDTDSRILTLESAEFGSDEFVQVNVIQGSFETTLNDNSTVASRDTGLDLEATINGQSASTDGLKATLRQSTIDATVTFAEASNTAGERVRIEVTGGGSLFQIGQEASAAGQIGIGIEAVNTARLGGVSGKLFELGTGGGKSLLDISPSTPGSLLVGIVEESIDRVSTLRGRLGAIQRNVIDTNINTLGVALENISEARSVITDTDFAQATADLTKSQILNQAGISVLSIANQNPQQVLSLLG